MVSRLLIEEERRRWADKGVFVWYADCISPQLTMFKIFIELQLKLNLKRVPYHEELIKRKRWGGITRLFQMDVAAIG